MIPDRHDIRKRITIATLISSFVTIWWLLLTWRYGLDVADEGYYWYGAQRMLHGEMPMRDFMAYDIGRYAWSAACMWLIGDSGIVGARVAAGAFQILTVGIGVALASSALNEKYSRVQAAGFAVITALILNLWVHPYYKVFDYGASILIVMMLAIMASQQSKWRWLLAGMVLGLSAIIGRNHGIYGAFASMILIANLLIRGTQVKNLSIPLGMFVCGTIIGFSPTFVMGLLIPGFAEGFIASIVDLVKSGATNIGLPVPWPWTIEKTQSGRLLWIMGIAKGIGFMAIILGPLTTLAIYSRKKYGRLSPDQALMLVSGIAGCAYAHYAYSRADLTHLALAMPPLLLLLLVCGAAASRVALVSLAVAVFSILTLTPERALLAHAILKQRLDIVDVNSTTLYVYPQIAKRLHQVETALSERPLAKRNFLAIPDGPGLNAIFESKIPIWEIYSLSPRDAFFERAEVQRISASPPDLIFLSDHPLDNRSELRYSKMHPRLTQWILNNYHAKLPEQADDSSTIYVRNH